MAIQFEVDTQSFQDVATEFRRFAEVTTPRAGRAGLARAGALLTRAVQANISIPAIGGSPEVHRSALAAFDHPYAKRWARIRITPSGGYPGFRRKRTLIHTVSGKLLSALTARLDSGASVDGFAEFNVGLDTDIAPHAEFVVRGSAVMHPRDTIWFTATDPRVMRDVRTALVSEMRRAMGFG